MIFHEQHLAKSFSEFAREKIVVSAGRAIITTSPYKSEMDLVKDAVLSRKIEFFSARYYARQALKIMGSNPGEILRGEKGNPIWPSGVIGSITHDQHHVIVVTTKAGVGIQGIGIDLIVNPDIVEWQLQHLIATENELKILASLFPNVSSLALAFSLKESTVKAVSPQIDHYMNLLDIEITLEDNNLVARIPNIGLSVDCKFIDLTKEIVTFAVLHL